MKSTASGGERRGLRLRLAVMFALFGSTLVSLLLSGGVFLAAQHTSDRLMDETLSAELDDYMARRARNPASLPPATISIRGYVYKPGGDHAEIPPALADLPVGKHQLQLDGIPYRISVAERGGERFVMMFDETRQRVREDRFLAALLGGTLVMALVTVAMGWWLAGRVVAPVAELARLISSDRPERDGGAAEFSDDEIGKFARGVFGEYVKRMQAFVSREQAFTTDVSHELRTPLSIVRGVVELMEDDPRLDAQQRGRIDRIRRAVDGMIDVTSALLLMARAETPEEPPAPCDVSEVVGEAIDAHRHLVNPRTAVRLECRSRPHLPVEGTLLKIVVANLVRNAFAHTEAGSVTVVVDDESITVTDTGRGIPGEEIGKVFQKHFKGAGSDGAGIGLSLVKRICDRYGWETALESVVGEGTSARLIYGKSSAAAAEPGRSR